MIENNTRDRIEVSLINLLEKNEYRKISINLLIQEANVSKATFYRYFDSLDDCIECILEETLNDIFTGTIEEGKIKDYVLKIFTSIYEKRDLLQLFEKRGLLYKLNSFILDKTIKQIKLLDVLNNYYQPYFFAGASYALIIAWCRNGFQDSPKVMTKIFFESLKGYMSSDNF